MFTINRVGGLNNLSHAEFYALAKDVKPIDKDIPNGSIIHVIDYKEKGVTKDWVYDAEEMKWNPIVVSGGGGEGGTTDYNGLQNKPSINGITLEGNKTSKELGVPSMEIIQQLEDEKANYTYKVIATDRVSQADAREVLTYIDQYDGKLIEFLTNGDLPSKCVATGRVMTDKNGNSYLIAYNLDGTVTQWNKDTFEKHLLESKNYTTQMVDLDNFTIDVQGEAPFVATVNKAFNKPPKTSDFGNIFVFAYNTEKQIQVYRDMDNGKVYQRLITGQADRHSFGTWVGSDASDGTLVVNISKTSLGTYQADATESEIQNADRMGKVVIAKYDDIDTSTGEQIYYLQNFRSDGARFYRPVIEEDAIYRITAIVDYKGDVTFKKVIYKGFDLEGQIDLLFKLKRNTKVYQTELYLFDTNPTSTGIKTLANKSLVCEPSTDTEEGRDDYEGIGLFDWYDCNYITNEYGRKVPTAVKGIGGNFIDDGYHDVGVLQMTPYWNVEERDGKQIWTISDTPNDEYGLVGWEYAKKEDGTFAPYIIHSKYHSSIGKDGLLRSVGNAVPERNLSHNKIITESQKKGKQCWGSSIERNTFQLLFQVIKYATKNSQNLWTGCTNYSYVYPASLEYTEEHTYFPVTNEQANSLIIGSRVSVGYNDNRAYTDAHAYADSAKILKIETLDEMNKAVYLDVTKGFNTTKVDGKAVNLLTMHWASGATNKVIGKHDGSLGSNKDYKHPYRIQGLEYAVGGYVIPTDVIMSFKSDYSKDVMLSKMGQEKSTSDSVILSTYTNVGNIPNIGDGEDFYIGDIGVNVENCAWYPLRKGTSYTNGHGDYCYAGGKITSGTREFLTGGYLGGGTHAGSVCLDCRFGLGFSVWYYLGCD